MKKVLKKLGLSIAVVLASIILWIILVYISTKDGNYGRVAPYWVLIAPIMGIVILVTIWTTWRNKNESNDAMLPFPSKFTASDNISESYTIPKVDAPNKSYRQLGIVTLVLFTLVISSIVFHINWTKKHPPQLRNNDSNAGASIQAKLQPTIKKEQSVLDTAINAPVPAASSEYKVFNNEINTQNKKHEAPQPYIIEYVYSVIKYVKITNEYIPRKVLSEGKYIGNTYFEPIVREEKWEEVETPYIHFSTIQEYGNLTEDLKYKLLDEAERSIRNDIRSGIIKIKSREVKKYFSYADASKAIEAYKIENNLKSVR